MGWRGRCRLAKSLHLRLRMFAGAEASALAEFAVALPLLVVLVVGIFDFGGAFNTKQELNNAAREGARLGASLPTNDLSNTPPPNPPTVDAVRYVVDSYLQAARINDCGLGASGLQATVQSTLTFVYQAEASPCSASSPLTLTIIRGFGAPGCTLQAIGYGAANPINPYIPCTQVIISYPYQWIFNSVVQLIVPGASYGTLILIQTDATAINMD